MTKEERFAILRNIVDRLQTVGKAKTQKVTYFLQNVFDVPFNYVYKMHYYGPYSEELDNELIDMRSQSYINIERAPDGYEYHITPGNENMDSTIKIQPKYKEQIDNFLDKLNDIDLRKLELISAIHFIQYLAEPSSKDKNEIIKKVMKLKPFFSEQQIEDSYESLEELVALK